MSHERNQPNTITVPYVLQCRGYHHPGSEPGEARQGSEWLLTADAVKPMNFGIHTAWLNEADPEGGVAS